MVQHSKTILFLQAVLVFGVIGASRGDEITYVMNDFVRDNGQEIIISMPSIKTKASKVYKIDGILAQIVRQYKQLRPPKETTDRFFIQYRDGKCTMNVIGKNTVAKIPKEIASYLQLPDADSYTAYSFRQTSTIVLADALAGINTLKPHGQTNSPTVAEGKI